MKSDQPVISVIIPVYNVEKFLRECLDSVLAQSFSDFEVLLVDDGSTDGSGAICDEYVERDPRVRVFHRENRGQAAARNFAVFQTEADWIAFVDSDDIVHPQYLEILLNATVEQDVRISMCDSCEGILPPDDFFDTVNSAHSEKITLDDDTMCFLHEEYKLKYCDVWGKLIDRTIIEKIPFTEGRIFEDAEVSCRWFAEAGEAVDLDWGGVFLSYEPGWHNE